MACNSIAIAGLKNDCLNSQGGIRRVILAVRANGNPFATSGDTDEPQDITGITSAYTGANVWYEYFNKAGGSMVQTLNVDNNAGYNYVGVDITMQHIHMNSAKRLEYAALSVNELAAIVEDSNGKFWGVGGNEALLATAGTGTTGTQKQDGNFYNITLHSDELYFVSEVPKSVVETLTIN